MEKKGRVAAPETVEVGGAARCTGDGDDRPGEVAGGCVFCGARVLVIHVGLSPLWRSQDSPIKETTQIKYCIYILTRSV